jgi:hypothetical protein
VETDVIYFARRALEERLAAKTATHELARRSHLEMAERYEELASAITEREQLLGLHLISEGVKDPVCA